MVKKTKHPVQLIGMFCLKQDKVYLLRFRGRLFLTVKPHWKSFLTIILSIDNLTVGQAFACTVDYGHGKEVLLFLALMSIRFS